MANECHHDDKAGYNQRAFHLSRINPIGRRSACPTIVRGEYRRKFGAGAS
jgi:hypothetical protein